MRVINDLLKNRIIVILTALVCVCSLTACTDKKNAADGVENVHEDVLLGDALTRDGEAEATFMKTSKKLDVDNIPEELEKMVALCDAINLVQVASGNKYNYDDASFVWRCIHAALYGSAANNNAISVEDNVIVTNLQTVTDYAYAMFGKLKSLPQMSELQMNDEEAEEEFVYFDDNQNYVFSNIDRGLTDCRVKSVTVYSDASVEMEVMLFNTVDDSEEASFIYTMRANTRDTSTAAKFAYEITNVRSADRFTSGRMLGVPYMSMKKQQYPDKSELGQSVEEIPMFSSYGVENRAVKELNGRIDAKFGSYGVDEIIIGEEDSTVVDEEDDNIGWHEIISYPKTGDDYVQVLVWYNDYPCYATMGNVVSYNYDVNSGSIIELMDAPKLAGFEDARELVEALEDAYKAGEYKNELVRTDYEGFLVIDKLSVEYYFRLFFDGTDDAEPYDAIASYNSSSKQLKIYESDQDLVSDKDIDVFYPPLTHGK